MLGEVMWLPSISFRRYKAVVTPVSELTDQKNSLMAQAASVENTVNQVDQWADRLEKVAILWEEPHIAIRRPNA